MLLMAVISMVLVPAAFAADNYPGGGVLRGVKSTETNSVYGNTVDQTDGKSATFGYGGANVYWLYTFSQPKIIDAYYIHGVDNTSTLELLDSTGAVLRSFRNNTTNDFSKWIPIDPAVPGVTSVRIRATSYLFDFDVKESPPDLIPPEAPTNLVAVGKDKRVSLTWTASPDNDVSGYYIYQDGVRVSGGFTKNTYFEVTGLDYGQSPSFQVTAVDYSANESEKSNVAKVTTYPAPILPNLTYTSTFTSVTLNWQNLKPPYDIYQIVNGTPLYRNTSNVPTFTFNGLNHSTEYLYYVVYLDNYGRQVQSTALTAKTRVPEPLTKPVLTYTSTEGTVKLVWESDGVASLYDVFQSDGSSFKLVNTTANPTSTVTGLSPETEYRFYVVAKDDLGRSIQSDVLTAQTKPLPPPVKPVVTVSDVRFDRFTLNWSDVNATSYDVYVNGSNVRSLSTLALTVSGLKPNETYKVKVAAHDQYGRIVDSDESVITTIDPPSALIPNLTFSALKHNSVRLNWNDVKGKKYKLFQNGNEIAETSSLFYQVNGLTPSTDYAFKVRYVDEYDREVESNEVTVRTLVAPAPTPTPVPTGTPPPVSNSGNDDLNKSNDYLVQGAKDTKEEFVFMIGGIIILIILCFGFYWLIRLWKKKMGLAASPDAKGTGSGKASPTLGAASKLKLSETQRIERTSNARQVSSSIKSNYNARNNAVKSNGSGGAGQSNKNSKPFKAKRRFNNHGEKSYRKRF